jgi:hypothetical protein
MDTAFDCCFRRTQVLRREEDSVKQAFYRCCHFSKPRIIVSSITGAEICWCGDLPPLCGSLPSLELAQSLSEWLKPAAWAK